MKVIRTIDEMRLATQHLKLKNAQIGFVPTMGFFHEGHLKLMEEAKLENDIVVASIFVNPLQFGPTEDFEQYPRDEEKDIALAEKSGIDLLFIPDVKEMYPNKMIITMQIHDRTNVLCGRSRPGHFDGVITVLTKLFNIVQPNNAYFGLKDAQQIAVVKGLINDLNIPVNLKAIPTIREVDGLAKSSRNVYLDDMEREQAVWLHKALTLGKELVIDGETNPAIIVKEVINIIELNTSATIDYVEILSYPDLKPITSFDQEVILAGAIHFKRARLIDNLIFTKQ